VVEEAPEDGSSEAGETTGQGPGPGPVGSPEASFAEEGSAFVVAVFHLALLRLSSTRLKPRGLLEFVTLNHRGYRN